MASSRLAEQDWLGIWVWRALDSSSTLAWLGSGFPQQSMGTDHPIRSASDKRPGRPKSGMTDVALLPGDSPKGASVTPHDRSHDDFKGGRDPKTVNFEREGNDISEGRVLAQATAVPKTRTRPA